MSTRLKQDTVTFIRPFTVSGLDGPQPPGAYTVEIEEERIESLSFLAYRRLETRILIPLRPGTRTSFQSVAIDQRELDGILARDRLGGADEIAKGSVPSRSSTSGGVSEAVCTASRLP